MNAEGPSAAVQTAIPPPPPEGPPAAVPGARHALLLLVLINLFNYIDRQVLAAVEPEVASTFFPKVVDPVTGPLAGHGRQDLTGCGDLKALLGARFRLHLGHFARLRKKKGAWTLWSGRPVATLQKAQARVQREPRIITVACFCFQHSPILGQAASSHTVASPYWRISLLVSAYSGELGARTLIQSGLRRIGLSGRWAF